MKKIVYFIALSIGLLMAAVQNETTENQLSNSPTLQLSNSPTLQLSNSQ